MRFKSPLAAIALVALLLGCSSDNPVKANNGDKDSTTKTNGTTQEAQGSVHENLKNDAYEYSGLGQQEKLTYQGKLSADVPDDFGVQSVEWMENKDGDSFFKITRTGILSGLGTETVRLDESGAYITGISAGSLEEEAFKLPNPIEVGTEWTTTFSLRQATGVVNSTMNSKVVRKETVKVPAGEFECLVVESTTTVKSDQPGSNESKLTSTSYHAKGIGEVKLQAKGTNANGEDIEFHIELAKIGE